MSRDLWITARRFERRYRGRFLITHRVGQTVFERSGTPLWTEISGDELPVARGQAPTATIWTEHVEGDGSTYYSKGIARVNRSGAFILVLEDDE